MKDFKKSFLKATSPSKTK